MSTRIDINDLPPDAIAESNDFDEYDDLTVEDCGFDDQYTPIENHEEELIADSTDDSQTTERDMSDLLCTVIPDGGHVYGFQLVGHNTYNVYRFTEEHSDEPEKDWEGRGTIELQGNLSLEIAFGREIGPNWTTLGLKSNIENTLIVIGVLPKGE